MKTIAIENLKGGVGKTCTAAQLGNAMSQYLGQRVLLLDMDPSCDLTSFFLQSIGRQEAFQPDVASCIAGECTAKDAIRKFVFNRAKGTKELDADGNVVFQTKNTFYTDIVSPVEGETSIRQNISPTRCCVLDLLPGSRRTEQIVSPDGPAYGDKWCLRHALEGLNYDIAIIDFPPSELNLTVPALYACDYLLVPAEPDRNSFNGLSSLLEYFRKLKDEGAPAELLGVFLTKTRLSETSQADAVAHIMELFNGNDVLLPNYVRQSSTCGKCNDNGYLSGIYEPGGTFIQDYLDIAKIVLQRMNGNYSWRVE